jgi:CubicO group peptidase (beta-lactamase class C family)
MVKQVTNEPSRVVNSQFEIGQASWDDPDHLGVSQLSMSRMFRTVALETSGPPEPLPVSNQAIDILALEFDDPLMAGRTIDGDTFLNRRLYNDALLVVHNGMTVHESYRNGMNDADHHVIHSCTKSLLSMVLAIAIEEGLLDPRNEVTDYMEEFCSVHAWRGVTLQHVWDMQAGISFSEDYDDPEADYWRYARAAGYYPTLEGEEGIGVEAWVLANLTTRDHLPGTVFAYNSSLTIVLGIILERAYGMGLAEILETKLYGRVGPESDGLLNTDAQGFPIVEGQLSLTLRDFARVAQLMVNDGRSRSGDRIVPSGFFAELLAADPSGTSAYHQKHRDDVFPSGRYKNHFWIVEPEQQQIAMLGIHGQFAWCDLTKDLLIVGLGSYPKQDSDLMMSVLKALWNRVSDA